MDVSIDQIENSKIAVVSSSEILIADTQDALDLMATIHHIYGCNKMIINKEALVEGFFDLKTGIAGEIVQKYTNYGMKVAIIGDFQIYHSKSLADFIRESNKGNQIYFLPTIEIAIDKLHSSL